MVGSHVPNDGQPQSGAARVAAASLVDSIEALEDPLEVAAGDTDAVIAHGQLDPPAVGSCSHVDIGVRVRVLHGVLEEVVEGRYELPAIAED